jgi:hypothetical protein
MAKAGLSFASPMMDKMSIGPAPNPYEPLSPTSGIGVGNLGQSAADMALLGEQLVRGTQFTLPEMRRPPDIGVSESTGELFVQGRRFSAQDAATALESEALLGQPGSGELPSGFVPLDEQAYQQYLGSIRDPSPWRLGKKSFGRGVDVQQLLAGRALQAFGAEELGGNIAAAQEEQLRQTSPFARQFTDIGEPNRGVLDWFVGNLAEQGPNLLISALTGIGGAAAGQATVNASTRALAKQFLKPSNSQSVINAAKKYASNPSSLTPGEVKLLHEAASITAGAQIKALQAGQSGRFINTLAEGARGGLAANALQQARTIGAGVGLGAQGYVSGVGDIYGSTIDAGDPDRSTALLLGIPYAALEGLTEFAAVSRIFGTSGAGRQTIRSIQGRGAQAAEVGKRAAAGLAVGGTLEGTTEAGQEALLLGVEDVDWNSPEGVNRLVNSFAAGFGTGGPFAAAGNILGKVPVNLLDPGKTTEPIAATSEFEPVPPPPPPPGPQLPFVVAPGTQGQLFGQTAPTSPVPGLAPPTPGVAGVAGPYTPVESFGISPATEVAPGQQDLFAMGQQDLFGGPGLPMEYPVGVPAESVAGPVPVAPGQGVLQFVPPAPTGMRFTDVQPMPDTQIAQQFQSLQRQTEFDQAMVQRREAETTQAEAQRQLQLAQPAAVASAAPVRGPRQFGATEPQQLPLFGQRGLPRPSGAERLRRGATPLPETAAVEQPVTQQELEAAGQLPMFPEKKSKGAKLKKGAKPKKETPPKKKAAPNEAPPKKEARVKTSRDVDETYDNGGRYVGRVDADGVRSGAGVYTGSDGLTLEGTFKDGELSKGKLTYPDKTVLEGTFEDGVLLSGTQTESDGKVYKVKDGVIVEDVTPKPKEVKPVEITLEMEDGKPMVVKDGRKFLDKLNKDILKYEKFLACLTRK